jgi:hypothetical protein
MVHVVEMKIQEFYRIFGKAQNCDVSHQKIEKGWGEAIAAGIKKQRNGKTKLRMESNKNDHVKNIFSSRGLAFSKCRPDEREHRTTTMKWRVGVQLSPRRRFQRL